jgi:hypothetical protein
MLGIPNPKIDVIDALNLQEVGFFCEGTGVGQRDLNGHGQTPLAG